MNAGGYDNGSISRFERGMMVPSIEGIHRIALVLRIKIDDLIPDALVLGWPPQREGGENAPPVPAVVSDKALFNDLSSIEQIDALPDLVIKRLTARILTASAELDAERARLVNELGSRPKKGSVLDFSKHKTCGAWCAIDMKLMTFRLPPAMITCCSVTQITKRTIQCKMSPEQSIH